MSWVDAVDLSKISDEDRYRVLEYVVRKIGREKVMGVLGVSRVTLWGLPNKQQRVDDGKLRAI